MFSLLQNRSIKELGEEMHSSKLSRSSLVTDAGNTDTCACACDCACGTSVCSISFVGSCNCSSDCSNVCSDVCVGVHVGVVVGCRRLRLMLCRI